MPSLSPVQLGHGRLALARGEGVAIEVAEQMGLAVVGEPAAVAVEQQGGVVDPSVRAAFRIAVEQRHAGPPGDLGRRRADGPSTGSASRATAAGPIS